MKRIIPFLMFFVLNISVFAQLVNSDSIQFKTLSFYTTKEKIEAVYSKPLKVYESKYDCGFYSKQEQGETFFVLEYNNVKFIGNEKGYIIEEINLANDTSLTVLYGQSKLSSKTTDDDLQKIFESQLKEKVVHKSDEAILYYFKDSDDGIIFLIKNNRLVAINYWSPC